MQVVAVTGGCIYGAYQLQQKQFQMVILKPQTHSKPRAATPIWNSTTAASAQESFSLMGRITSVVPSSPSLAVMMIECSLPLRKADQAAGWNRYSALPTSDSEGLSVISFPCVCDWCKVGSSRSKLQRSICNRHHRK